MKILFLDIDGVLNDFDDSHLTREDRKNLLNRELSDTERQKAHLDPKLIQRLNRIVQETQCKIVLSSAWRNWFNLDQIQEMFSARGFSFERDIWIGKTENFHGADRGIEILKFLVDRFDAEEEMPESFCIVDDMSDMEPFVELIPNRFVQTNDQYGIIEEDCDKIIEILNNSPPMASWEITLYGRSGMSADHVGPGWKNIVKKLFFEMKKIDRFASFIQVKEKFGLLRVYANSNRASVHELCWKAEEESEKHCEYCGSKEPIRDVVNNGYWIRNLCQACRNILSDRKKARREFEAKVKPQKDDLYKRFNDNLIGGEELFVCLEIINQQFDNEHG